VTRKLLIIDDEDDIRQVVRVSLERLAGWHVLEAASGWEGAAIAASEGADAVLLDVVMPDLGGLETLALLRDDDRSRDIPVLLLTGRFLHKQAVIDELGVAGVVPKPFDPMRLHQQVAGALGWAL
jgi:CheY-like chemotaxis protein